MNDTPCTAGTGGLAGAVERGLVVVQGWTNDGTLLSASDFAARMGATTEALAAADARGELFSLVVNGQPWYPAELLKIEPGALAAICAALGDKRPSGKFIFLAHNHGGLDGETVSAAVAQGRLERVLYLAEGWKHR